MGNCGGVGEGERSKRRRSHAFRGLLSTPFDVSHVMPKNVNFKIVFNMFHKSQNKKVSYHKTHMLSLNYECSDSIHIT